MTQEHIEDRIPLSETIAETALEEMELVEGVELTAANTAQGIGSIATQVEDLSVPGDRKRRVLVNAVKRINDEVEENVFDERAIASDIARSLAIERFRRLNRTTRRRIL